MPEASPWYGRRIELAELRWYNGHPVGFFKDVADRTAAESLVKAILWIDQDPEEAAEPDAWYDHELIGLDVVRDGETVGTVDRLEHLPAQDLLVVQLADPATGDRREVLVPFVRALVPEVDVEARRVVVTPPEGLFEPLPEEDEPPSRDAGEAATGEERSEEPTALRAEAAEPDPNG